MVILRQNPSPHLLNVHHGEGITLVLRCFVCFVLFETYILVAMLQRSTFADSSSSIPIVTVIVLSPISHIQPPCLAFTPVSMRNN